MSVRRRALMNDRARARFRLSESGGAKRSSSSIRQPGDSLALQNPPISRNLPLMRRRQNSDKCGATALGVSLAALIAFFLALVLGAAPALHASIHTDAGVPQHECAITVLEAATQLADSAPVLAEPQPATRCSSAATFHSVWVATPFSHARVFEHAPPALS